MILIIIFSFKGETVLHIAARKGNYEVIRLLTQNDIV